MKPSLLLLMLAPALLGSCIYSPKFVDCKVRCADDQSCPTGTTCDTGFCRPKDAEGFCACSPGEERPCGGGQGECLPGVQRCNETKQWGTCLGEVKPIAELCDGKDNNCNGTVDDNPSDAPPCGRSLGVCAGKVQQCVQGAYSGQCEDAEYGPDYQPVETRCDGKDNDCDGFIDSKPPVHLINATTDFQLQGVDGGFVLAWAEKLGAVGSAIKAQSYDAALKPVGPVHALGTADSGVTLQSASDGRRAYFSWQSAINPNDTLAAYIDSFDPAVPVRLFTVPAGDARSLVKIAANPGAMLAAYPSDGGFVLVTYPTDGGATTRRLVVPPDPAFASIDNLALSSAGTTISLDANKFTDDAGTTTSVDLVYALDGTNTLMEKYVYTGSTILDTKKGVTSLYSSYCYSIFIFTCNESYVIADFDVWNPASSRATLRTTTDYTVFSGAHSAVTPNDWVMTWLERKELYVASPVPAAQTTRYRRVDLDGGIAVDARIANPGGQQNAIVYSSSLLNGSLEGVLVCAP